MTAAKPPSDEDARAAQGAQVAWLKANGFPREKKLVQYVTAKNPHEVETPEFLVRESLRVIGLVLIMGPGDDVVRVQAMARQLRELVSDLEPLLGALGERQVKLGRKGASNVIADLVMHIRASGSLIDVTDKVEKLLTEHLAKPVRYPTTVREWQAHVQATMLELLRAGLSEETVIALFPVTQTKQAARRKQLQRARKAAGMSLPRGRPVAKKNS